MTGHNGNIMGDYDQSIEETRKIAEGRIGIADNYKYIILTPVFPRGFYNNEQKGSKLNLERILNAAKKNKRSNKAT